MGHDPGLARNSFVGGAPSLAITPTTLQWQMLSPSRSTLQQHRHHIENWRWRKGKYVQVMHQRGEGRGDDNGLDRGRVDIVDDNRGMLVQELKQPGHYSTCNQKEQFIQQYSSSSRTMRTGNRNREMGHEQHGHVGRPRIHGQPGCNKTIQ